MSPEEKIKSLGLSVPPAPQPVAAYVPAVKSGSYIYTSGQLPLVAGELKYTGKIGQDLVLEEGYEAAKICALNCLAAVKSFTGSLDEIVQIIRLTGFVNSGRGFTGQPQVINGASELLAEIFGEKGRHARSAVGVSELPLNAAVELEMIVQIR
ncbi:Endoribonuclease L-PSP [Desulfofarcimen acetoxidans DSM 771]|uniref:Endoribonuclease L-PSP n=1 Tax=Desulfofarcimen acetoxidans (strain ATCC 49208 / DSM 771 / KCTC 5769 / VKM B-1644 / 5575) TaxID=485916 RepID=C8W5S4_DESAS|nr:RidA family protein [Desulfofarcimen acetoxidans]ACV64074.1 Endoribonuclease L-PSP [Desulfofarcimen acetoxidans DSM 771]